MATASSKIFYCDANIFIYYFNNITPQKRKIDQLFEQATGDGEITIVTSMISLVEISFITVEQVTSTLRSDTITVLDDFWNDTSLVEILGINETIAKEARELIRLSLVRPRANAVKPIDAIHLADCGGNVHDYGV